MRYHKKVYFPEGSDQKLTALCDQLNDKAWQYTAHSLDGLKYRAIDQKAVLLFIKDLSLEPSKVFEYYIEGSKITKICYRVEYTDNMDLVIVISKEKNIVTIYSQLKNDEHITLNSCLYCKI